MTIYRFQTENQSATITTKDIDLVRKMANANEMFELLQKTLDLINDPDASEFQINSLNSEIQTLFTNIQNTIDETI